MYQRDLHIWKWLEYDENAQLGARIWEHAAVYKQITQLTMG